MNPTSHGLRFALARTLFALLFLAPSLSYAQSPGEGTNYVVVMIKGDVSFAREGSRRFDPATLNLPLFSGDTVRVGRDSQLALRRADQSVYRFFENTEFQILPPETTKRPRLYIFSGLLYFFHRDKPTEIEVLSRMSSAGIRGTEFTFAVDAGETTTVDVIDGSVELRNAQGAKQIQPGQEGVAIPGQEPLVRPILDVANVIQWTLYYPGILDPEEVPLTADERALLGQSIAAYASGNLVQAVALYPPARVPQSDPERLYRAALLLSVGKVDEANRLLGPVMAAGNGTPSRLASALETMIAVVKGRPVTAIPSPEFATEWLVESYCQQASGSLDSALTAAQKAVERAPRFGFAWARVAELEFSFGRTARATQALEHALAVSPENAAAITLHAFLYAARNRIPAARAEFDRAITHDAAYANAWLGRGLTAIRSGDSRSGLEDLLTASALEPQRSLLRSYLGKAWSDHHEPKLARHEIDLARKLDPRDPTPWLYSALLNGEDNRVNEAIREIEYSQELNTNRAVFRSRLLLDQDHAVRSANVARLYADAGLADVAVREAQRAVNFDYGNYSAHRFLAASYSQEGLLNPWIYRFDTLINSEFLLANLLSPVGAGLLSPSIAAQEYSRLFDRDGFSLLSSTEFWSSGKWRQQASQSGRWQNFAYNFEVDYLTDPGQRPNADFEFRHFALQLKQQVSDSDTFYAQFNLRDVEAGDLTQRYDWNFFVPEFRANYRFQPVITLGYRREWNPESQTIVTVARVPNHYFATNPFHVSPLVYQVDDQIAGVEGIFPAQVFVQDTELYSVEPQHIWQHEDHTVIAGARFQIENIATSTIQTNPMPLVAFFPDPPAPSFAQQLDSRFERFTLYGYHQWQIVEPLRLIGGLTYDYETLPQNFTDPPLSTETRHVSQLSPKAGFIWTPVGHTTLRGAYTRSLGGATLDDAYRIEPNQVAGFAQAYRALIPESIAGGVPGAESETYSLLLEQRFATRTYMALSGELLNSWGGRERGAFFTDGSAQAAPFSLNERLDYTERTLFLNVNQLLGDYFAVGFGYRLSDAKYSTRFTTLDNSTPTIDFDTANRLQSTLQQLNLYAVFNHPLGFFGRFDSAWYSQSNRSYNPDSPGDDFWQFNLFAGYRFAQRRAELMLGLLNLANQDYQLSPLNLYNELPRKRTFYARLQFNF